MSTQTILVTGALGQIGRVLIERLVKLHGAEAVLATDLAVDVRGLPCAYRSLDATDAAAWAQLASSYSFNHIYHLVAVLSAKGEANPWRSWDINMQAWRNVLEQAPTWPGVKIFFPSSIAVYGPPLPQTVDETQVLTPTTSYGMSKVAGEMWADYCAQRDGTDVRCLRLPGVIGYQTLPGGGTTDYAVDIFHKAVLEEPFTCFLEASTRLPMIYMDDVLRGITEVMEPERASLAEFPAPAERHVDPIREQGGRRARWRSTSYNLNGFSVSPQELAQAIQQEIPNFEIRYAPDHRQAIAETWPEALDGSYAQHVWNWQPRYTLADTVADMISNLRFRQNNTA